MADTNIRGVNVDHLTALDRRVMLIAASEAGRNADRTANEMETLERMGAREGMLELAPLSAAWFRLAVLLVYLTTGELQREQAECSAPCAEEGGGDG